MAGWANKSNVNFPPELFSAGGLTNSGPGGGTGTGTGVEGAGLVAGGGLDTVDGAGPAPLVDVGVVEVEEVGVVDTQPVNHHRPAVDAPAVNTVRRDTPGFTDVLPFVARFNW